MMRDLSLHTLPDAAKMMRYRMPTYDYAGEMLCAFAAQKRYMSLYWDPEVVAKHKPKRPTLQSNIPISTPKANQDHSRHSMVHLFPKVIQACYDSIRYISDPTIYGIIGPDWVSVWPGAGPEEGLPLDGRLLGSGEAMGAPLGACGAREGSDMSYRETVRDRIESSGTREEERRELWAEISTAYEEGGMEPIESLLAERMDKLSVEFRHLLDKLGEML